MNESGKRAFTSQETNTNIEQAKALMHEHFDAAAAAVFAMDFKSLEERTDEDYRAIEEHKGLLVSFRPELMDGHFTKEVEALISRCNEILDEPLRSMFGEE